MKQFARDNGLSLFFLGLFLVTVAAQSIAGQHAENAAATKYGFSNSLSTAVNTGSRTNGM